LVAAAPASVLCVSPVLPLASTSTVKKHPCYETARAVVSYPRGNEEERYSFLVVKLNHVRLPKREATSRAGASSEAILKLKHGDHKEQQFETRVTL
jgi:hypothetical protein